MSPIQSRPLLSLEKINFHYHPGEVILENIALELYPQEILGVVGPNGGGKSTLLKIMMGELTPKSGQISWAWSKKLEHYQKVSYLPQQLIDNDLLPLTLEDFLTIEAHTMSVIYSPTQIMERLNLTHKRQQLLRNLSGGEKQRAYLARALMKKPALIILDEPTQNLDTNSVDQLLEVLVQTQQIDATAIILVDHNLNQVLKCCNKILCLNRRHHWHDTTTKLTNNILAAIYQCEFEHLVIHQLPDSHPSHCQSKHHESE